jgi:hypothetical protein
MTIPESVLRLKKRITSEVEDFFETHRPEDVCLVLDSTGPSLTKHYIVLQAIGVDRLSRMGEIHAFSGGVWAYFGYLALIGSKSNHAYEAYGTRSVEAAMRRFHHPNALGPLRALYRLARRQSAFGGAQPIRDMLSYYFADDYLARKLDSFPPNLHLHLGLKRQADPLEISTDSVARAENPDILPFREMSIRDIIVLAITVPFVYGMADHGDRYFDAAYTLGYVKTLKCLSSNRPATLVSTPWRKGRKAETIFVNCFDDGNPKVQMALDFTKLILNMPNRTFGHDIAGAFLG